MKDAVIVDGSIGSDTDTSKVDAAEHSRKGLLEGQEQIRPYTVKKSATFKPVSITKNFLAKAGTTPTPPPQSGSDKGILMLLRLDAVLLAANTLQPMV